MSPNKTVLLVDDEQAFLEPLADALEFEGYRVLKARTVEEAVNLLESERIDVVTIDIMLDPGEGLGQKVDSHSAGLLLCRYVREKVSRSRRIQH